MYILENTMLKKSVLSLSVASAMLLFSGCAIETSGKTDSAKPVMQTAVDGGIEYSVKNGQYTAYKLNTQNVKGFTYGRTPTKNEIAAWNKDVMPDGEGLPEFDTKEGKVVLDEDGKPKVAQGTVGQGNELYDSKCAMCHGDFGAGGKGYPALSGGDIKTLKFQLQNPADEVPGLEPPSRKIGSYWPYASTLFWYIQDSMPFPHPKSLTNSETYAIAAYLLSVNEIKIDGKDLDDDFVMNKEEFLKVKMPNRDGFYPQVDTPDNPHKGVENMTNFLKDPKNFGQGTRCMTGCYKGSVPVLHIKNELNDFHPAPSTVRDLPEVKENAGTVSKGAKIYEATCSACHANEAIGAPVVGNKEVWAAVVARGMKTVYDHAINGFNAMPPKGGNMDLSDADVKETVDYMVNQSK